MWLPSRALSTAGRSTGKTSSGGNSCAINLQIDVAASIDRACPTYHWTDNDYKINSETTFDEEMVHIIPDTSFGHLGSGGEGFHVGSICSRPLQE